MISKFDGQLPQKLTVLATKSLAKSTGKTSVRVYDPFEIKSEDGKSNFIFHGHASDEPNGKSFKVGFTAEGVELKAEETEKLASFLNIIEINPNFLFPAIRGTEGIEISPKFNDFSLKECDRFVEKITVTIPKNARRQLDIYFLADNTFSMNEIINTVKTGTNSILTAVNGLGHDIAYGVGSYRDFTASTPGDPNAFIHQLSPTSNVAAITTAINNWVAVGGGDTPEAQFFALDQLAQAPGGSIGWRTGSKRIIVWFGDAPAHDPICDVISGLSYSITEASVTNKLVAEKITVLGINVGLNQLDSDPNTGATDYGPCTPSGSAGQATRITTATGGSFSTNINTTNIVNTIISIINAAVAVIGNVSLVPTGGTKQFVTSIDPAGGYGPLSGDSAHTLTFKVGFTGVRPCDTLDQDFYGALDVVADGVVVASKKVHIKVPACCRKRRYSYSVKFVVGRQEKSDCLVKLSVSPGEYTTEINIHNYQEKDAEIDKYFIPLVKFGQPIGREPEYSKVTAKDKITLPGHTATMDDTYRIMSLLEKDEPRCEFPITIGFLHIVSSIELSVTAVYTASNLEKNGVTIMSVEQITAKEIPLPLNRRDVD